MERQLETYQKIERSIIKKFRKQLWTPFIVAVNCFHGMLSHNVNDVREALAVPPDVPLILCDARDRESTKAALLELVQHAMLKAV